MNFSLHHPHILLAVDVVVIAVVWWNLQVLLVQRSDVKKESRVLPWWFIDEKETLLQAAKRKLGEETWYNKFTIHELGMFDAIKRDPRTRVVSAWFLAVTNHTDFPFKDGYHTYNAQFFSIDALPYMLYDHKDIVDAAVKKLQKLVMYTNTAKDLLSKEFTLTELQGVYENILGKTLNVRNFRKKLLDEKIVFATGNMEIWVWHRPAQYYSFV